MIALKIIRWFWGYVDFCVHGGYPERFLNFTARFGISLWNMKKKDGVLYASVNVSEYRSLRPLARKAGSKLRVKKRHGLPFLLKKCSNKKGIFVGAIVFALLFSLLSLSVWSVDIKGNTVTSTEEVSRVAAELGLVPGTAKKDINAKQLQQQMMRRLPNVSWLSVNTRGCTVTIELQEKVQIPPLVDKNKICNIKAAQSGQIIHMDVFDGKALVKEGDAVVEGQLLVSGIVEDAFGGNSLKHASAKIIAETTETLKAEVPLKQTQTILTGKVVTRRSAKLFGIPVPLTFVGVPQGNYKCEVSVSSAKAGNSTLPLSVCTETWTEQQTKTITLTQQEAARQAEQKLAELQKTQLKNATILSSTKNATVQNGVYALTLVCKCRKDIAVESEILVK